MERVIFDNVWKQYDRLYGSNRFRKLAQTLLGRRPERNEFWALRGLSFRLEEGMSLGIVGPNGSGKTTALRILSGICHINRGHVLIRGSISALIALGAGFHPELTGRENIHLNGSILGLSRREIRDCFDDIVDFADIGPYIDSPVKRYSSGMFVRLGFAVAAQVKPDILLVDEVLAVGDARFQARCHQRIRELRENGAIIVLVSHDMWAIRQSCGQGILLHHGEMRAEGDIAHVLESYDKLIQEASLADFAKSLEGPGGTPARCELSILNERGEAASEIDLGDSLIFRLRYECAEPVERPCLVLSVSSHAGPCAMVLRSRKGGWEVDRLEGSGHVDVRIESLRLNPGRYAAQCSLKDSADMAALAVSGFRELFVRRPDKDWCTENCYYVPEAEWLEPVSDDSPA